MRPTYSDTALFVGSDSGATDHNSIAVSSDTVLLVEKAHGVQIGTRDLKEPLLNVIRIERFGRCATSVCYGVSAISTVSILGRCSLMGDVEVSSGALVAAIPCTGNRRTCVLSPLR